MKWISKDQPQYVFLDDVWERETDGVVFMPDERFRVWKSLLAAAVLWTKKTIVMKYRDKMKLQPVGRSLLVKMKPIERKSKLLLPSDSSEQREAEVIGVGDKVEAPIKEGDSILLAPYCGVKVAGGDEDTPYFIIGEKEVLGIIKE